MNIEYKTPNPLIRGVLKTEDAYTFTMEAEVPDDVESGVILYKKGSSEEVLRIPFKKGITVGNVMSVSLTLNNGDNYDYNYYIGDKVVTDSYAKVINFSGKWGSKREFTSAALLENETLEEEKEKYPYLHKNPGILLSDNIIYRLHVRGFTKSATSKVKNKGTFLGVVSKIDYLKELGINMVELMPSYDFFEMPVKRDDHMPMMVGTDILNYWGYTDAYYFAPKASFASDKNRGGANREFKYMVSMLHEAGIEVCMEFMFMEKSAEYRIKCLRYWVMEYGIDAIHLTGVSDDFLKLVKEDALLGKTKIMAMNLNAEGNGFDVPKVRRLASYNDGFLKGARHFLKGDEDQISSMCYNVRNNPNTCANINFLSNNGQMTLYDTVSFDRKYNEANGEGNNDGAVNDFSWNCGCEGATRKRKILDLRKKQIKNALSMLLLSQGVPLIMSGDERANTQNGNNNPYCQDNEISYIKWTTSSFEKEIFEFTKALIAFRKNNTILHMPTEMRNMDYLSKGFPDMSFHGSNAWYLDSGYFNRHFSLMLCGEYAVDSIKRDDIFVAFNMHWEEQSFDVPMPRPGRVWKKYVDTSVNATDSFAEDGELVDRSLVVTPRTTVVLIGVESEDKKTTGKHTKRKK